jgi:RNA polymerase sigma-70 factor (ECF subfamily)
MAGEPTAGSTGRNGRNQMADFARVVEQHWTPVYRFLYRVTGHAQDTEDLAQETFLKALERLETFAPGTNLRAWLLKIACNAFLDSRRKQARLKVGAVPPEVQDRAVPADHRLETAEQVALVRAALDELTDLTRAVFHLRVQEELPFRDIAALVGTTEESARWHMHQARTVLLARLQRDS